MKENVPVRTADGESRSGRNDKREKTMKDFVVLDLETTGLTPKTDRILEIGAIKVVDGEVKERYATFINPQMEIPARITELTGITREMVADAPYRDRAVRALVEFCGDLPLLGHNIRFDYSFVKHDAVNLGLEFEKEAVDTLSIARLALPQLESRSLEFLCGYYGISRENAHRAMDDAAETLELYRILERQFAGEHPEWFRAQRLICKVRKEGPVTRAQIGYLKDLMEYHHLTPEVEISGMTKNEASRMIDTILSTYGRIERKKYVERSKK